MAKQGRNKGNASVKGVLDKAKAKQLAEAAEADVAAAALEEIMDIVDVTEFKLADAHVTASIIDALSGLYQTEVVYNIPKRSATGKKSWPVCKRMPNGYCKYEGKDNHMHILGISYQGALIAANVYGGLDFGVEGMPQLIEFGDKNYWVCEVYCHDLVRNNSYKRWQFEPEIKTTSSGGYYNDPFAMMTVQSKGVRNLILACIPQSIQTKWKQDFRDGKTPFDPQRVLEHGQRRITGATSNTRTEDTKKPPPKEKPKPKPKPNAEKPKPKTQGIQDLEQVCKQLAQKIGQPFEKILQWTGAKYDSPGKAMTSMVDAMTNPIALKTVRDEVAAYTPVENEEAGAEAEAGTEAGAQQEEMNL